MASASSDVVVVEENVRHETTERVRVRVHGCTSLETNGVSLSGDQFWASPAVQLAAVRVLAERVTRAAHARQGVRNFWMNRTIPSISNNRLNEKNS